MKILEIIMEAKPDNLGQGLLDKIFAVYQKRDINDMTIPKFSDGLDIAEFMFKYSGPQKLIWTAKQYTTDQQFFLHDLANWKNIFDLFDRPDIKQRLERKDINQYKSIDELKSVIQPLMHQRENMTPFDHILEAVDKFVQKGEAEWLYRGPEYSIYHPISFNSSKVLYEPYGGEGIVDVCTVTGKDLFNKHYSPNGYLIYTLTPDNFCVAFINSTDTVASEFSDKGNDHLDYTIADQLHQFPKLRDIIQSHVKPRTTWFVKVHINKDYHLARNWVAASADNLSKIPLEMIDDGMLKTAIKTEPSIIRKLHPSFITYDIAKYAIQQDAERYGSDTQLLRLIDDELLMTTDLLDVAVSLKPINITGIPKNYPRRIQLIKKAISKDGTVIRYLHRQYLRDHPELCLLAVKNTWNASHYVPNELPSEILAQIRALTPPQTREYE